MMSWGVYVVKGVYMRSSEVYEVKFGIEGQVRRSGGKGWFKIR